MYYCSVDTLFDINWTFLPFFRRYFERFLKKLTIWRREALHFANRRLFDCAVWIMTSTIVRHTSHQPQHKADSSRVVLCEGRWSINLLHPKKSTWRWLRAIWERKSHDFERGQSVVAGVRLTDLETPSRHAPVNHAALVQLGHVLHTPRQPPYVHPPPHNSPTPTLHQMWIYVALHYLIQISIQPQIWHDIQTHIEL